MKPEKELEQIYKEFEGKLKEVAKDAISDVICEYVPYAETDFYSNVEHRTRDWIEDFFNGKEDEFISNPMLNKYHCKEARQKVFEENKEEIIKLIGEDKEKEIERLKSTIESLQEFSRY